MSDKAPVRKFRLGGVTASVWKNEGAERAFYTVTIQRAYKDTDGNWKNTDSFNSDDLLNASYVLRKAGDWIMNQ